MDRSIYEDHYFAKKNHDNGGISDVEMQLYDDLLAQMMSEIETFPKKAPDVMISSLKNDENGLGYISLSTLSTSTLTGLSYESVKPSESSVLDGTYKMTRNFNYIVRDTYKDEKVASIVAAYRAFLSTSDAKATMKQLGGILSIASSDPTWASIKANYPVAAEDNKAITIHFGGSTSVEEMAKALSKEFSPLCGNFVSEHNHTGSGDAYKRTQGSDKDSASALDIAFASREFSSSEAAAKGTTSKMCTDAIVAAVNAGLPALRPDLPLPGLGSRLRRHRGHDRLSQKA